MCEQINDPLNYYNIFYHGKVSMQGAREREYIGQYSHWAQSLAFHIPQIPPAVISEYRVHTIGVTPKQIKAKAQCKLAQLA